MDLFYNAANLANQLDEEKQRANASNLAKQFRFFDADILDELSYLLFSESRSDLLFHIISSLHEKTS